MLLGVISRAGKRSVHAPDINNINSIFLQQIYDKNGYYNMSDMIWDMHTIQYIIIQSSLTASHDTSAICFHKYNVGSKQLCVSTVNYA